MNEGEDYWFFDNLLTEPGYYTAVIEGEECDSVVGLNLYTIDDVTEDSETDIQVWPNPTNGVLHIAADHINKVEIRNLLGQMVLYTENTSPRKRRLFPESQREKRRSQCHQNN